MSLPRQKSVDHIDGRHALTPAEANELESMLKRGVRKYSSNLPSPRLATWVFLLSVPVLIIGGMVGYSNLYVEHWVFAFAAVLALSWFLDFALRDNSEASVKHRFSPTVERMRFRRYLSTLAETKNPKSAPLLLLAFKFRGNPYADAHRRNLAKLLPRLVEENCREFDERHLRVLNELVLAESGELQRAVVLGLAEVGNSSSLPALEKIVETQLEFDSELRLDAQNAMARIKTRMEASRSAAELLRPNLEQDVETLLKPATEANHDSETPYLLHVQSQDREA